MPFHQIRQQRIPLDVAIQLGLIDFILVQRTQLQTIIKETFRYFLISVPKEFLMKKEGNRHTLESFE